MVLEAHTVIARRATFDANAQALIDDNGVTAANFQGVSVAWNTTGEEIVILLIADTGV